MWTELWHRTPFDEVFCKPLERGKRRAPLARHQAGVANPLDRDARSDANRGIGADAQVADAEDCAPLGARAAMFRIGTIVSYRGRLHVVVGVTPMSVTPQLVELEDRESEWIRRVPYDDLQLFKEPEQSVQEDDRQDDH